VEYAVSIGIPVEVHREKGLSQWILQYFFPFLAEKGDFFLAWEGFFHKIRFELGGGTGSGISCRRKVKLSMEGKYSI
jgi:hypothetical protein